MFTSGGEPVGRGHLEIRAVGDPVIGLVEDDEANGQNHDRGRRRRPRSNAVPLSPGSGADPRSQGLRRPR